MKAHGRDRRWHVSDVRAASPKHSFRLLRQDDWMWWSDCDLGFGDCTQRDALVLRQAS
jgi:hypothetical protein